jgi:hypothetical protein
MRPFCLQLNRSLLHVIGYAIKHDGLDYEVKKLRTKL